MQTMRVYMEQFYLCYCHWFISEATFSFRAFTISMRTLSYFISFFGISPPILSSFKWSLLSSFLFLHLNHTPCNVEKNDENPLNEIFFKMKGKKNFPISGVIWKFWNYDNFKRIFFYYFLSCALNSYRIRENIYHIFNLILCLSSCLNCESILSSSFCFGWLAFNIYSISNVNIHFMVLYIIWCDVLVCVLSIDSKPFSYSIMSVSCIFSL